MSVAAQGTSRDRPVGLRVAIVGPARPLRGGIAAHTEGLAAAMSAAGHDVRVLSYRRLYPSLLFPGSSERGEGAVLGQHLLDTLSPRSWLDGRRWLAARDDDLVLVQWWHPVAGPALAALLAGARQAEGAPTVFVCHNLEPHESFPGWRILSAPALSLASGFLCHSRVVAERASGWNRKARVACCPLPILGGRPPQLGARREAAGPALRLAQRHGRGPLVVAPGHVRRYKGIDLLLAAWAQARLPEQAVLLVAGESYLGAGRLDALVRDCARGASVCVWGHYLSDAELLGLLEAADLVVLPHRRATQSGLLPLAAAAGAPLLCSDAGGLGEQAGSTESATLFAAGDVDALAAALESGVAAAQRRPARSVVDACGAAHHDHPLGLDVAAWEHRRSQGWAAVVDACCRLAAREAAASSR
jgi:D-inositol-3-phosphate glycosyltransferase